MSPPRLEGPTAPPLGPEATDNEAIDRKLAELPREVGVMLMTVGTLGFVLPGMVGMPALLAGGLVLWPKTFSKVETWFERRWPRLHQESTKQIGRYLTDLDRRYPIKK